MYFTSSKMLKHFVVVAFIAALALSMTPSHQASGEDELSGDGPPAAQIKLPPAATKSGLQAGHPAAARTEVLLLPWA